MARVLVAMSGGVDSSVAAALLKEQGHEVIGVTMQVWDYTQDECNVEEGSGTCCSSVDVDDARAVADHLDIPFYVMNCETEFKAKVIDNFVGVTQQSPETTRDILTCRAFIAVVRDQRCFVGLDREIFIQRVARVNEKDMFAEGNVCGI